MKYNDDYSGYLSVSIVLLLTGIGLLIGSMFGLTKLGYLAKNGVRTYATVIEVKQTDTTSKYDKKHNAYYCSYTYNGSYYPCKIQGPSNAIFGYLVDETIPIIIDATDPRQVFPVADFRLSFYMCCIGLMYLGPGVVLTMFILQNYRDAKKRISCDEQKEVKAPA